MKEYGFNIGDEVITIDGIRGTIVDICDCDRCIDRGFREPIWEDDEGTSTDITDHEAARGFENYYKIGNYYFSPLRKDLVERDITHHEKVLDKLHKQLQRIEELEQLSNPERVRELERQLKEANEKLNQAYAIIGKFVEDPNPFGMER